jgi:hypothetical protein
MQLARCERMEILAHEELEYFWESQGPAEGGTILG